MRASHIILYIMFVALMMGCTGTGDTQDVAQANHPVNASFDQTKSLADSLYSCMQFRDAYDLYLQLLDNKEAEADSEKKLDLLNALCNTSELAGHKAEQTKWLEQLISLAKQTGNGYYHAIGLGEMGQNVFYEGDREQGIRYVSEAIDLMAKTDRTDADHLIHSYLIQQGEF